MPDCARRFTPCHCRVKSCCDERRCGVSIIIHRNGDTFNPGRRVFINHRLALTWSSFMEQIRRRLGQYTPAIRCIVSPNTGTRIHGVLDLNENHRYIAVPRGEVPKLLDYQKVDEQRRFPPKHLTSSELFEKYWRRRHIRLRSQVGRLSDGFRRNVKVIFVYRNGDTFTPAIRVHLRPIQAMDFELIMRAIQDSVILPYGKAVRRNKCNCTRFYERITEFFGTTSAYHIQLKLLMD
ncbi:Doublecortin domain-containing protein [Schistosoma japonicum]|uniref:Doublecortin domain-containing protein n=1 Tax=Schistosoma japonicum TaxID=6182 RepID=A0A4Z2D3R9_SCHJA|nr:Doublecortin domain-containing protein [Schistosoma japonicum]